jgi:tetratricopeptide (TPR) repeat protein
MKKMLLPKSTKIKGGVRNFRTLASLSVLLLFATVVLAGVKSFGAEAAATNSPPVKSEDTNSTSQEVRVYLQLQEQLHATQLEIERIRKETAELAAQNNETLSVRLQAIEQSLSVQRSRELDAMQSSNRVMLTVAGAFAGMGFIAMVLMGYFQWKTVKGLADVSSALPAMPLQLAMGRMPAALGPGGNDIPGVSPAVEQANPALLESIHQLEKRLRELEHPATEPVIATSTTTTTIPEPATTHTATAPNGSADAETTNSAAQLTTLLNRGQSLLNTDKAEEALACFENVLAIEPNHADALVKKGTALEKLRKLNEAIDCYDRAIAADGNMTIAYLYKGGVFNRMERFSEALECYEQALRTQEKKRA